MVSSLSLLYIHLRLTEIMGRDEFFGGISVVFFADLLQLPPVKGNQPFITVTSLEAKQRIGCIGTIDLWTRFEYQELTINMRQRGDKDYANLLSAVRIGTISDCQLGMLQQQLIATGRRATVPEIVAKYRELSDSGLTPIVLMPTVAMCAEVNTAMLATLGEDIHALLADDKPETIVSKKLLPKVQKAYEKVSEDSTRTAGLEKKLSLSIGAKVMLKRNQNVDAGLVNGSIGTVEGFKITQKDSAPHIHAISVKFSHLDTPVNIERESFSFEVLKSVYYTRRQFPIMPAFAITIHKSQGLSLQTAIVDAGPATFGPGMIYVGLSRVTTLHGLHLIDIDRGKIICDIKAISEYNRLRQLYTPHLGDIRAQDESQSTSPHAMTDHDHVVTDDGGDISAEDRPQSTSPHAVTDHGGDGEAYDECCTSATASSQHTGSNRGCIYQSCEVESLSQFHQQEICNRLNLQLFDRTSRCLTTSHTDITRHLRNAIYKETHTATNITIEPISGHDGNCLFRAISQAVTNSQTQHEIIRTYIVNIMSDPALSERLQQMFANSSLQLQHHLLDMQESGEWGTEQEIAAAAHLLDCSILCYSKYNTSNQYCLQHFSPHFVLQRTCSSTCNHPTIYLLNASGIHYECAVVQKYASHEQ